MPQFVISILRRWRAQPAAASSTMVLAVTAGLSMLIYTFIFSRLAFLPEVWDDPLRTGAQISLRILDGGRGLARVQLITGFAALGVLYFFAYRAAQRAHDWVDTAVVVLGALGFATALLFMYPFGAADIFDNIIHGRMIAFYGANPFDQIPAQFRHDPILPYVAWKSSQSAYGPLWEIIAGETAWIAGHTVLSNIYWFKLLPGFFWGLTLGAAWMLLRRARRTRRVPALPAFVLLAWNPLILYEVWGNAHNDIAMAFFVLLAAWMLLEKRYTLAIGALAAGALIKYIPLLLIPTAGVIALWALPTWRRRGLFVLSSAALAGALIFITYAPFWVGIDTLTIGRRATMLSGSIGSAVHSILVDGPARLPKEAMAKSVTTALAGLTALAALVEAWRARRRPDWEGFIQHSFYIYMFYLLVTVPWFQQWYAIWPLVLLPFLDAPARGLALVFGFAVLGKQLWVDPSIYWGKRWAPLPAREIGFALGNLAISWLCALYVIREPALRVWADVRARLPRRTARPAAVLVPVTGECEQSENCEDS